MTNEIVGILGILLMFVLMFLRAPISVALGIPGVLGILYLRGWSPLVTGIETIMWQQSASYIFSTIPLFVLMGELLFISGISSELFGVFQKWFNRMRGGLATATIGASTMFSLASGSSIGAIGTMGVMAHPEMKKVGYDSKFSSGTIIAGGTLAILLPPSTAFILYGILAEQSIGKLFIAGIVPGIILILFYLITVLATAYIQPKLVPKDDTKYSWKEKLSSLKSTIWLVLLFVIIIGGMYIGLFSPTEAAGIGASTSFVFALIRRKLTFAKMREALERTIKTTGFIFAIIIGAFLINYFLMFTGLPDLLSKVIADSGLPAWVVLLLILVMYIILGAVLDALSMIVITLPIIAPTILMLGYDMIWFGVFIVLVSELALITPPVGMGVYVLKGAVPELNLGDIFKGALRFTIPILVLIFLLFVFPEIATWLPNNM